jgi:hypothetical protein
MSFHTIALSSTALCFVFDTHSPPTISFGVHAVSTLSLTLAHSPEVSSIYRAVAELSAKNTTVPFVRVESKDVIGEVKTTVDEAVVDLFVMYRYRKNLEQTTLESEMHLLLSRVLAKRNHLEHRRR